MKDVLKALARLKKEEVGIDGGYNFFFSVNGPTGTPVLLLNKKPVPTSDVKDLKKNSAAKKFMSGKLFLDDKGVLNIKANGDVPAGAAKAIKKDYAKKANILEVVVFSGDDGADDSLETKSIDPAYANEATYNLYDQKFSGTHYNDEGEKLASGIRGGPDGKLVDSKGKPVDGYQGYVVDPKTKKMHTFKKGAIDGSEDQRGNRERMHHSSPLAGSDVAGAGGIRAKDGKIERLDDRSGHYKPNSMLMLQTIKILEQQGAALVDKELTTPDGKPFSVKKYDGLKKSLRVLTGKVVEIENRIARNDRRLADPKVGAQKTKIEKEQAELKAAAVRMVTEYNIRKKQVALIIAANRPAKVAVQGKDGRLADSDWVAGGNNVDKMNAIIEQKLGIKNFLADDYKFFSLTQLNLDLGRATEREMTVDQFKQGSDDKARNAKDAASISIILRRLDEDHGTAAGNPPSIFVRENKKHPDVLKVLRAMMAGKLEGDAARDQLAIVRKAIEARADAVEKRQSDAAAAQQKIIADQAAALAAASAATAGAVPKVKYHDGDDSSSSESESSDTDSSDSDFDDDESFTGAQPELDPVYIDSDDEERDAPARRPVSAAAEAARARPRPSVIDDDSDEGYVDDVDLRKAQGAKPEPQPAEATAPRGTPGAGAFNVSGDPYWSESDSSNSDFDDDDESESEDEEGRIVGVQPELEPNYLDSDDDERDAPDTRATPEVGRAAGAKAKSDIVYDESDSDDDRDVS